MRKQRAPVTRIVQRSATTGKLRAVPRRSPAAAGGVTADRRHITFQLFVAKETSGAEMIRIIRNGVGARLVDEMVRYLDVPKNVVFNLLHTPESTAHRLIRDNRRLDSAATERVVRVADVTRVAEEVFGGREAAIRWLKTPNLALADATPLSMLDTEPGAAEVRRILSSIDYGGTF
jgi:putative toxin-antitoxin system antitoxin component (TIGR02293 family)